MEGPLQERWKQLCKLVAEEKDPARFEQLVEQLREELNKLGEEKARLRMLRKRRSTN